VFFHFRERVADAASDCSKGFLAVGLQISADSPDDVRVRYWDRRSAPLPNLQLCDQDQAIFVIRRKVSSRERVKLNVLHGTPIAI
jgi:hypothetical protein